MDKKYLLNVCIYFFSGIFALFLIFFVLFHLGSAGETNYRGLPYRNGERL